MYLFNNYFKVKIILNFLAHLEFKNDPKLINVIQASINNANSKATANPHKVQKFFILPIDLSVAGEELGPTLKLKRHFIIKKYSVEISKMYEE